MNLPAIINLPRCGGKTTALVYASAVDRIPILCFSISHKKYIEQLAKKLGVNIPEPLACNPKDLSRIGGLGEHKVLIDNAEIVIPNLIKEKLGIEIAAMTMSVPMSYPSNATQECLSRLQRETKNETFDETTERLMETIKMRSLTEAAGGVANILAEIGKDFGISID